MKPTLPKAIYALAILFIILAPRSASGQANTSFPIENTSSYASVSKMFTLSGNRLAVLTFDASIVNLYMKIFNASGTLTSNINITSRISWNHNTHGGVAFNAIQLNNGNIFITHVATTNSTGIQTYNARYTVITEAGAAVSSGQLNTVNMTSSYVFGVQVDKLSDGKIVSVFRKTTGDNIAFRLFNADGTSAGSDVNFSGTGTANSFAATYGFKLAAGKNGNFIVTAYFWSGALRGFIFTNAGVTALAGSATHFMMDPTNVNAYGNTGLVGLPDGNFAQTWYLSNNSYYKVVSPTGVTIVDKHALPAGSYLDMLPYNTPGSQGFVIAEIRRQDANDMGNPYTGLFIRRYNLGGILQSTTQTDDGWMIQPTFTLLPGIGGGFAVMASYYRSFVIDEEMPGGMAMASGDNDISGRMVAFSMSPLPVTLISYNVSLLGNNTVRLEWKTASEENNSRFVLERSLDGTNYSVIGTVAGQGTIDKPTDYSFTDALVITQPTYYRLKQFDIDGRTKDLGVKVVTRDAASVKASVYPNPAAGSNITLSAGTEQLPAHYQIVDMQGRVVLAGSLKQAKETISLEKFTSGTYLIKVGKQVIRFQRK